MAEGDTNLMDIELDQAKQMAGLTASSAILEELEGQYVSMKKERDDLQLQLQDAQSKLKESNQTAMQQQEFERQTANHNHEMELANGKINALQEEKKIVQERMDRLQADADKLRDEISRLGKENSELTKKIGDFEVQSKLTESEAVPLYYEKQRLTTELSALQAHSNWLEQELSSKSNQYQHLQRESRDRAIQLQLQLDQTINEKDVLSARLTALEKIERKLQEKVNQLSSDILSVKQELATTRENTEIELQEERKIINLQKEHIARWQQRYEDAVRENENLKLTATQAMGTSEKELENERKELEQKYTLLLKNQAADYEQKLKEASGRTGMVPRLALPPPAATNEDDDEADGPLNMTELYAKLEETKTSLRKEVSERKVWQLQFQRVQKDITEMAPKLIRQREEYEMAVGQLSDYQERLEIALSDREEANREAAEFRRAASTLQTRLAERQAESEELAKQVQALLVSRSAGGSSTGTDGDIPTSVQEMQSQNQRLLVEHRRLTQKVAELESKLQTNTLRSKLDSTTAELKALKEERKEQEILVERIVQQRDLYRALLAKHDSNLLGSENEELTALEMAKQQSERAKKLEHLNRELEGDLKSARSEIERMASNKEAMLERMNRFEVQSAELTSSIDKLERDLLTARSDLSRSASEAEYHKEKCERAESALERARNEINQINTSKNELQRINADLQASLSTANSQRAGLENEKRQAEMKARLLETQLETSKAAEKRVTEDNKQLRSEVARQGALIESVRRIEASLSANAEGEKESLKIQNEQLNQRVIDEAKQHKAETNNLNVRIQELEARIQDISSSKDKALAESFDGKKKLLESATELKKLSSKCKLLESQLRNAKKKLGESDADGEDDVAIQSRIDKLESELESVKAERDALKESSQNYQKIAKDSEKTLADVRKEIENSRSETSKDAEALQVQLDNMKRDVASKDEIITELTNDLANQRGEREKAEGELNKLILSLKAELQNNAKDVESAKATCAAMTHDMESLRSELKITQNNYERELGLHSQARSLLRAAREEADEQGRMRQVAEDKLEDIKKELDQKAKLWEEEKESAKLATELLEKNIKETREQNTLLHTQLDTLTSMVNKNQSARIAAATATGDSGSTSGNEELHKVTSELREVVKFLRSENEIIQTQLDAAKRAADREKAASNVLRRSLDEVRSELNLLRSDESEVRREGVEGSRKDIEEKLRASEEQAMLLKDSNKLLREEMEKIESQLSSVQKELNSAKESARPAEEIKRNLETNITALESEKESLKRELESWKDRVKSLVSKFHQIDPEEHKKLGAQVQELKKENESLNAWKKATEAENGRIRNIAKTLNIKNKEQKTLIDSQKKDLDKLNAEKVSWTKTSAASSLGVKERDELKERITKLEKDAESKQKELEGANNRNDRLREKLREFQTTIRDLRAKEKSATQQLELAKAKAAEVPASTPTIDAPVPATEKEEKAVDSSAEEKQETETTKPVEKEVPSIPQGGFKFGPSDSARPQSVKAEDQAQSLRADASPFIPAAKPSLSSPEAVKPAVETEKKTQDTSQLPESSSPSPASLRRPSGDKKELSMKQMLMAKKLKLREALLERERKRKQQQEGEKVAEKAPETTDDNDEQASKRAKVANVLDESNATDQIEPTPSKMKEEKTDATESANEGTFKETSITATPEESKTNTNNVSEPKEEDSSEKEVEQRKPDTPAFGSQSSTFPFGSPTPGTQGLAFGQSSTIISAKPSTGFGTQSASSSTFGGAFLNMKPPGNTTPPTFTFGNSSSITLPTPSQPIAPNPFGAFGSSTSFGSNFGNSSASLQSRPLFGAPAPAEAPKSKEEDDGAREEK